MRKSGAGLENRPVPLRNHPVIPCLLRHVQDLLQRQEEGLSISRSSFSAPGKDPLSMPAVSWSDQRENRSGLVRELLGTLWKEECPVPEKHEAMKLVIHEDAGKILETRRILTDTFKLAIRNGENSGQKIERPDGAFVTCLKPASVTYWIVYRPLEDGAFEVLNAWSHRMTVPGTEGSLP